tara:strand:+ start:915 stop:1109 length:195 start_codon:yes stop_codon:yes gene_type:complete
MFENIKQAKKEVDTLKAEQKRIYNELLELLKPDDEQERLLEGYIVDGLNFYERELIKEKFNKEL